jgi:hypothetical protein
MKKSFALLIVLVSFTLSFAQPPQKMSYQAVIRNNNNQLVTNHVMGMKISILHSSISGTAVYAETQTPTTNANGLVTIEIGGGNIISGIFASIDWSDGPYFVKTETDPSGGTNYTITGTSQLLSVPYALYAKSAENVFSGDYNDLTNKPALFDGSWANLTSKPSFANVATSGNYNDLYGTPTIVNSQWTSASNNIYYNLGNVGIGVSSPSHLLELYSSSDTYLRFMNASSGTSYNDGLFVGITPGNYGWLWNAEAGDIYFGTNNTYRMTIESGGQVDIMGGLNINSAVPDGKALYVYDKEALWFNGTYFSWGYGGFYNYFADPITIGNVTDPTGYALWVQGDAWSTGSFLSSDARYKKNISTIDHALDKLMKVRGTTFEFRTDEFRDYHFTEGTQFGFIAQELENVFPEVVKTDYNDYKSVNYNGMIPVITEAVKEQQAIIEKMQKEIDELKAIIRSFSGNQTVTGNN